MLATFVIYLREGVEASMIVAILLSFLKQSGQRQHFRDVFLGVGAAFVLITTGGVAAYILIGDYASSSVQIWFETAMYLVATVALTGMTFWMQKHARTMRSELQARSEVALSKSARFGMAALSFQAVSREGIEAMVFTLALLFASSPVTGTSHGAMLGAGAAGVAVSLALAVALYRFGAKLNIRVFFRVLGFLLLFFGAGLLVDAVANLQELGWLPGGSVTLWNTSSALNDNTALGDLAHGFFGYSAQPTALQAGVWVLYVVLSVVVFARLTRAPRRA